MNLIYRYPCIDLTKNSTCKGYKNMVDFLTIIINLTESLSMNVHVYKYNSCNAP